MVFWSNYGNYVTVDVNVDGIRYYGEIKKGTSPYWQLQFSVLFVTS